MGFRHERDGFDRPDERELERELDERRRKKRRRGRLIAFTAGAVVMLAIIVCILSGGFGLFSPPVKTAMADTAADTASATPAPEATLAPELTEDCSVTISEDYIYVNGKLTSQADLSYVLLHEYKEGQLWKLVDAHAIKASYDAAEAALMDAGIPYTEAQN